VLQPNAMTALKLLSGAKDASLAHDVAAAGIWDSMAVVSTHTGKVLREVPQDTAEPLQPGGPPPVGDFIVNITRTALQQALYAALPPSTVTCRTAFRSFTLQEDGRVVVQLESVGQGGEGAVHEEVCDLLVAADGIRSAVRAAVDGERLERLACLAGTYILCVNDAAGSALPLILSPVAS
jgi:2-polyprenyl-6-methoxyphenol hydroxylase-like FAD-dependent oxidoreductase